MRVILLLLMILVTPIAFAEKIITNGHAIFQLGLYQGTQGKKQHINIADLIGDTFTVNNNHTNYALLGLGFFLDGNQLGRFHMSYGVNGFYLTQTEVSGNVIQENLFNNLSYHYNVTNFPLYFAARSVVDINSATYNLVLDAGIGPNFMNVYHFREKSLDGFTLPDDPFTANTTTTLSGTLGIGIRINKLFANLPVECGYRFFYLGEGQFNSDNSQIFNNLKTGTTYANSLECSIYI